MLDTLSDIFCIISEDRCQTNLVKDDILNSYAKDDIKNPRTEEDEEDFIPVTVLEMKAPPPSAVNIFGVKCAPIHNFTFFFVHFVTIS